jgi:hypothetical protein
MRCLIGRGQPLQGTFQFQKFIYPELPASHRVLSKIPEFSQVLPVLPFKELLTRHNKVSTLFYQFLLIW